MLIECLEKHSSLNGNRGAASDTQRLEMHGCGNGRNMHDRYQPIGWLWHRDDLPRAKEDADRPDEAQKWLIVPSITL